LVVQWDYRIIYPHEFNPFFHGSCKGIGGTPNAECLLAVVPGKLVMFLLPGTDVRGRIWAIVQKRFDSQCGQRPADPGAQPPHYARWGISAHKRPNTKTFHSASTTIHQKKDSDEPSLSIRSIRERYVTAGAMVPPCWAGPRLIPTMLGTSRRGWRGFPGISDRTQL
jgi:hypothetical protein